MNHSWGSLSCLVSLFFGFLQPGPLHLRPLSTTILVLELLLRTCKKQLQAVSEGIDLAQIKRKRFCLLLSSPSTAQLGMVPNQGWFSPKGAAWNVQGGK